METWFVTYGCGYAPPGWNIHHHAYTNRLYVVLDGSACFLSPEGERPLKKGHLYLFPHRLPFQVRQDEANRLKHLYFDFVLTPPLMGNSLIEMPIEEDSLIGHTVSSLLLAVRPRSKRTDEDEELVKSYFMNLLRLVLRENKEQPLSDSRLLPVLTCIHEQLSESLTDTSLAELAHMEKNHFIRVFRRATGITPYQYLRQYRLNRAASLISAGVTVTEAAHLCGFENASSLSHAMKRSRDISPSKLIAHIDSMTK